MALTTEQVFALGILYNKLATIVYGEDGPKANNLQNATMYPLMEIAQLILRAHTEHRITPELDRLIAQTYFTITEDDMQNEFSKLLPVELQGSFALGYYHGKAKNHPVSPVKNSSPSNCRIIFMMPVAILALIIFLNIPPKTATQTRFSFPVMLPPFWTALNPQSTPPFKPLRSPHQPHPASARIFPPKFFLSLNCIDTSTLLKNREHPRFQNQRYSLFLFV